LAKKKATARLYQSVTFTRTADENVSYHEKYIDEYVKVEGREFIARVIIVPHADLNWDDHCRVDEKESA
jgi:hypothetical protein